MSAVRKPLPKLVFLRLLSSVATSMAQHKIVPDVIANAPKKPSLIKYPTGAKVIFGNILKPTEAKDMPGVKWAAEKNAFYTLCMVDPDAPSREEATFRQWHHWLIGNIPAEQNIPNICKGETLSEYIGPAPPEGTGLHRYIFLIYKQNGLLKFDEPRLTNRSADMRGNFSIARFAAKYNLGNPIAGNFYQAEYDDYVPILCQQLGS
ncbi:phosphatidylethanolamine-binding protein [Holotrichia oblita]|uniref:Phosphatidylethanolamine-binding protein n=1 Tax=Holotrichia oblita TaxID=644536 RepID=A0ACB9T785_HOLOL|nr:phosphatidylethanolamine-binding protein [Holotrichia oblita]